MSILSGYLVNAAGWRWMFIWEGLPAIIWAFFWWRLVSDRPANATWLTGEEKQSLETVLQKTTINQARKKLCGGIQIKSSDLALPAIRFLEHRCIWLFDMVAFHHKSRATNEHHQNRMVIVVALCICDHWYDRRFLSFRQNTEPENICMAIFIGRILAFMVRI
jgi:hypothetical protein